MFCTRLGYEWNAAPTGFHVDLPAGHRLHYWREVRHTAVFGFTFKILRGLELRNQADFLGWRSFRRFATGDAHLAVSLSQVVAVGGRDPHAEPDANADTKLAEPQVACENDQRPPAWRSLMIPTSRLALRHRRTMEVA